MLFIVGLSHVIATSAACVQVSFQQTQLRLCSKCRPLALSDVRTKSAKVICFSQGTVATFYRWGGYINNRLLWRFFGILCTKSY